jgi:thiamine transport system substrate-binding protein
MLDKSALEKRTLPQKLSDLLRPEWRRALILEDPRTSTPGLAFVTYVQKILGEKASDEYWKSLRSQWLTLAPGWDGAYGLFLKKEAPLVWSYVTSQAYHEEHGDHAGTDRRYQALIFDEGQPVQIEGAALVKGALHPCAKPFLEFLLTPDAQQSLMRKNWMMPVVKSTKLPESFKNLPQPKRLLWISADPSSALSRWSKAIGTPR